jgi:methyl-accepting chemotaxis protein
MENNVSPEQRLVLDRLLTKIAGSLDGAVDFWTLVCLGEFPIDRRRFLAEKTETLRAFILVAQAFLAEAGLADAAAIHRRLEGMKSACEKLAAAFFVLEQFRAKSPDETRAATRAVNEVYGELRELIRQVGEAMSLSVSYWQGRTPEREEYYQRILRSLDEKFSHARGNAASALAPST